MKIIRKLSSFLNNFFSLLNTWNFRVQNRQEEKRDTNFSGRDDREPSDASSLEYALDTKPSIINIRIDVYLISTQSHITYTLYS